MCVCAPRYPLDTAPLIALLCCACQKLAHAATAHHRHQRTRGRHRSRFRSLRLSYVPPASPPHRHVSRRLTATTAPGATLAPALARHHSTAAPNAPPGAAFDRGPPPPPPLSPTRCRPSRQHRRLHLRDLHLHLSQPPPHGRWCSTLWLVSIGV